MLADVKKAVLYGDARRSLHIELPVEEPVSGTGDYVGKLERAMYGTRDAPMIWEEVRHVYTWTTCSAPENEVICCFSRSSF